MPQLKLTADILAAALLGFEAQKVAIEGKIAEIRLILDGGRSEPAAPTDTGKPRKKRSAAVRRKMALAQRLDTPSSSKPQRRNRLVRRPKNQSGR